MLIRFSVENFLSFRDEVVFEMLASKDPAHPSHVVIDKKRNLRLLRAAAIYGANASGKSNLVKAIQFAKDLIVEGTKPGGVIDVKPFRLKQTARRKPSRFEFVFRVKDIVYTYGFALDRLRIHEEWLTATPHNREHLYFERVTSADGKVKIEFGPDFAGKNKSTKRRQFLEFVGEGTRPNQLFLTEAVARNVSHAKVVLEWFHSVLQVVGAESRFMSLEVAAHRDKSFVEFLGNFLKAVGTGVDGIKTVTEPFDLKAPNLELPEELRGEIEKNVREGISSLIFSPSETFAITPESKTKANIVRLRTKHAAERGRVVEFELEDESDGTVRLMHLIPMLFNSRFRETVYVIDELDRRLHTLLSIEFVRAFLARDSRRPSASQIVFSTHDTNLLDEDLLRNDETWFVEKHRDGSSNLYTLSDFKLRKGLKIERGYLSGRFGAIPFINHSTSLHAANKS